MRAHLIVAMAMVAAPFAFTIASGPLAAAQEATATPDGEEPSLEDLEYPIAALGGCATPEACIAYCEDVAHEVECYSFAKAEGFIEAEAAIDAPIADLGGCDSEASCRVYCEDSAHLRACIGYAETHDLMTAAELEEAKRVLPFLEAGTTPGGCKSEVECKAYCEDGAHFAECIDFAEKAGLVSPEDAAMARKVGGAGPGGCKSDEECQAYCAGHANECVDFAVQHGMIPPEEAEMARKFMAVGSGPGGCKDKESCRAYCNVTEHLDECLDTFVEMGVMDAQQAEVMRQVGSFGGPGGCDSEATCRAFCENPANGAECDKFGAAMAANDPNYPPGCRDRNLGPNACRALCESDFKACGIDPVASCERDPNQEMCAGLAKMPPACKERRLFGPGECENYCRNEAPDHCGFGGSGSDPNCPASTPGCPGYQDAGGGNVAPECKEKGITDPQQCGTYCQTQSPTRCMGDPNTQQQQQQGTQPPCGQTDSACWNQYCQANPGSQYCSQYRPPQGNGTTG